MQDAFLKIKDIKGESVDDKHKDEIDVLAWSWGASQSGTTHMGPGGGAGKVAVQDMSISKYVDKASPVLFKSCCNGKHFGEAILTVRKAGEKPVEYYKVTMTDLLITSVSGGDSAGSDRMVENITLNFAKVKIEYVPQKADGSADATVEAGWDIAANKEM